MAKIIDLPKLSPTMEEGTLVRWTKHEGESVDIDDLLAEVETDKATMEFRAFDKGVILSLLVPEGAVAKLGQPVAILGSAGEDISEILASLKKTVPPPASAPGDTATDEGNAKAPAKPANAAPAKEPSPPEKGPTEPAEEPEAPEKGPTKPAEEPAAPEKAPPPKPAPTPPAATHETTGVAGSILAPTSPRMRRIAREKEVDINTLPGSGEHGRVVEKDLGAKAPPPAASAPTPPAAKATTPPVAPAPPAAGLATRAADSTRAPSATRKTIARRLTEAWQTVPCFYLEADLDVGPLAALREQANAVSAQDARVSFNDFFLKAAALALREVPESNASWVDGQIVEHHRVDISMAVAIDDGLVTPVLRDVDQLSIRVIAAQAKDLAARARARKLKPEEMQQGVFSVSNLGMFQIDRFTSIINPPEGMILAVGAVRDVPVVRDGALVAGKRCAVTLSCDHRVVDGALWARFLLAVRKLVENPLRLI